MPNDIDWREELERFIRVYEEMEFSWRNAVDPYYHVGDVSVLPIEHHEPILFTLK